MSRKANILAILALAGIMYGKDSNPYKLEKDLIPKAKPLPRGTQVYRFDDGYECIAISQKSADRKHEKYLLTSNQQS